MDFGPYNNMNGMLTYTVDVQHTHTLLRALYSNLITGKEDAVCVKLLINQNMLHVAWVGEE